MTQSRFVRYTWFVLAYNVLVILWGAYVRATGSGAGCGRHWPLCNGVVLPRSEQIETLIEFSHRVSSSLAGVLVIILLVWAYRAFPKEHPARLGARLSLLFILIEGALGAGLVRFELVADNASAARAAVVAIHLVNTFILLGWLALTVWWGNSGGRLHLKGQGSTAWLLVVGMLGIMFIGGSGAITALGDTLFPSATLAEGIQQDLSPTAHFLVELRVWHPVIAVLVGIYLFAVAGMIRSVRPEAARHTRVVHTVFIIQLALGVLNVLLLAPVWMQLVHLLVADVLWIAFVLMSAKALSVRRSDAVPLASYAAN